MSLRRRRNGTEERRELVEHQNEQSIHREQLQKGRDAWDDQGNLSTEYIQEMTKTGLSEPTMDFMSNLLSQDYVLGYLQDAELKEMRWLFRVLQMEILRVHPGQESDVQGKYRAYLFDDERERLSSMTQRQEMVIQQFIWGAYFRATRSLHGWQQDKLNEVYNVSEVRNDDGQKDSLKERIFS